MAENPQATSPEPSRICSKCNKMMLVGDCPYPLATCPYINMKLVQEPIGPVPYFPSPHFPGGPPFPAPYPNRPNQINTHMRGCICPPGANLQCQSPSCPRKPVTSAGTTVF